LISAPALGKHLTTKRGYCDVVKCFLSAGTDINVLNKQGQSPLCVASKRGHCDVVKCLLSSDADINWCDHNGQSPLFIQW
jgi:ankyrin repeat protein